MYCSEQLWHASAPHDHISSLRQPLLDLSLSLDNLQSTLFPSEGSSRLWQHLLLLVCKTRIFGCFPSTCFYSHFHWKSFAEKQEISEKNREISQRNFLRLAQEEMLVDRLWLTDFENKSWRIWSMCLQTIFCNSFTATNWRISGTGFVSQQTKC